MHFLIVAAAGGGGKVALVLFCLLRTDSEKTLSFRISVQIQMQ